MKNQIAGEAVDAAAGEVFETISPVDLKPLAKVVRGKAEDIDRATTRNRHFFTPVSAVLHLRHAETEIEK